MLPEAALFSLVVKCLYRHYYCSNLVNMLRMTSPLYEYLMKWLFYRERF